MEQEPIEALTAAIRAYYAIVDPEVYIDGWVLVTHKLSSDMERDGITAVGVLPQEGQPFVTTRGLLDVALEGERCR